MPIEKREGESRDEFVSRCVSQEMNAGKPQDQALAICLTYADENFKSATPSVTDNTWSTAAPISVNLESYTDYPEAAKENAKSALRWAEENGWGDCGTPVGKARANQLANGEAISRDTIARMAAFERHRQSSDRPLGEGCGRLMWQAWGGDEGIAWAQRKLAQLEKESLSKQDFRRVKKVLFEEDFNEEDLLLYKSLGFKVLVRSKRKYKKQDKKVWNKLKSAGLSEDNLVFGEVKDLHKRYNFEMVFQKDKDPIFTMLSLNGRPHNPDAVLKSTPVKTIQDCLDFEESVKKDVAFRFAKIKTVYVYEKIPNIPDAKSGSREFCKDVLSLNKEWSLQEILDYDNSNLVKMFANYTLEPSVLLYRGGFYRNPDTQITTPFCRHQWSAKVVLER